MESASISNEKSEFFPRWLEWVERAAYEMSPPQPLLSPLFSAKTYARICGVEDEKLLMQNLGVDECRRAGIPKGLYDAREVYEAIQGGVERGPKKAKNKTSFGRGKRS